MKVYTHVQSTPSTTWVVTHDLNCAPTADVVVPIGGGVFEKILPLSVKHLDNDTLQIVFTDARTGVARVIGTGLPYELGGGPGSVDDNIDLNDGDTWINFEVYDDFNGDPGVPLNEHEPDDAAGTTRWAGNYSASLDGSGGALFTTNVGTATLYGGLQVFNGGDGVSIGFDYDAADEDSILKISGYLANTFFELSVYGSTADHADAGKLVLDYGLASTSEFSIETAVIDARNVWVEFILGPDQTILVDGNEEAIAAESLVTDGDGFTNARLNVSAFGSPNNVVLMKEISAYILGGGPSVFSLNFFDNFSGAAGDLDGHAPDFGTNWLTWETLDASTNLDGAGLVEIDQPGAGEGAIVQAGGDPFSAMPTGVQIKTSIARSSTAASTSIKFTAAGEVFDVRLRGTGDAHANAGTIELAWGAESLLTPVIAHEGVPIVVEIGILEQRIRVGGITQAIGTVDISGTLDVGFSNPTIDIDPLGPSGIVYMDYLVIQDPFTPFADDFTGGAGALAGRVANGVSNFDTWTDGSNACTIDGSGNMIVPSGSQASIVCPIGTGQSKQGSRVRFKFDTDGVPGAVQFQSRFNSWANYFSEMFMTLDASGFGDFTFLYENDFGPNISMSGTGIQLTGVEIVINIGLTAQSITVDGAVEATAAVDWSNTLTSSGGITLGVLVGSFTTETQMDYIHIEEL